MILEKQREIFNDLMITGDFRIIPTAHPDNCPNDCADNTLPEYLGNGQVLVLLRRDGASLDEFQGHFGTSLVYPTDKVMEWLGY